MLNIRYDLRQSPGSTQGFNYHSIAEAVERRLKERYTAVRILIHIEPPTYQSEQISF